MQKVWVLTSFRCLNPKKKDEEGILTMTFLGSRLPPLTPVPFWKLQKVLACCFPKPEVTPEIPSHQPPEELPVFEASKVPCHWSSHSPKMHSSEKIHRGFQGPRNRPFPRPKASENGCQLPVVNQFVLIPRCFSWTWCAHSPRNQTPTKKSTSSGFFRGTKRRFLQ